MSTSLSKLLAILFQSQQTQQVVGIQPQRWPTSAEEWHASWQAKGFVWVRTELEIDTKRQGELSKYRAITPSIEQRPLFT